MPSASRIFSRNQYAPVIFWETATLRAACGFAMDHSSGTRHLVFRPALLPSACENYLPRPSRRRVSPVRRLHEREEAEVRLPELPRGQQPKHPHVRREAGLSGEHALNGFSREAPDSGAVFSARKI